MLNISRWHTAGRLWDMLYELAVVGDLPLPSYSHASVVRSSNQKTIKAAAKASAKGAAERSSQKNHDPPWTTTASSLDRNGTASTPAKLQPAASSSAARSAIHQALYPRHAHLFGPRTDDADFQCDLSPSIFTHSSSVNDSQQPDVISTNNRGSGTQSMFARGSDLMSRSGDMPNVDSSEPIPLLAAPPSVESVYEQSSVAPSLAASSSTLSRNADMTPFLTATEFASRIAANQPTPSFHDTFEQYSTSMYNAPLTSLPDDMRRGLPEPPADLQSFTYSVPSQYQTSAPYPTATAYVTGMLDDTALSRETLAMWSTVPAGFK